MTGFQLFSAGFFVGALPGLVMVIRNMAKSYRLTRRVERLAWKEGQWLDFSAPETKRKLFGDAGTLLSSMDSESLANAKREAVSEGRRMARRHFIWGMVMLVGAVLGAFIGYRLAMFLGLPT